MIELFCCGKDISSSSMDLEKEQLVQEAPRSYFAEIRKDLCCVGGLAASLVTTMALNLSAYFIAKANSCDKETVIILNTTAFLVNLIGCWCLIHSTYEKSPLTKGSIATLYGLVSFTSLCSLLFSADACE